MAPDDQTGMIREKMWVVRPADTHLSDADGGGKSALAREDGTNDLVTHATLHPIEDDEPVVHEVHHYYGSDPDSGRDEDGDALIALAVLVAIELAPHAKRLWDERVLPAAKARWEKRQARRAARRLAAAEEASVVDESNGAVQPTELGDALDSYQADMSSEEARERFAAAVAARLFSDEQLRLLLDARIEDESDFLEARTDTLTPRQVGDRIAAMLEADPALLTDALFEVEDLLCAESAAGDDGPTAAAETDRSVVA
jgi:hypothetical protein